MRSRTEESGPAMKMSREFLQTTAVLVILILVALTARCSQL